MLPVLEIEKQITAHITRANRLVLTAPTGSGKTTQVPQILLRSGAIKGQIIVLQPRRLATRMVAARVAAEMKVELGTVVGYQTRHDSRVTRETKVRFMTEGLFLRLIQSDPKLPGVGAVVLDEFHERSLAADMSLGLTRRLQENGRDDLRLVVMSATLDAEMVSAYLGCETLRAGGRLFPVDVRFMPRRSTAPVWDQAAEAVGSWVAEGQAGDALVFMPGMYEINRTIGACQSVVREAVDYYPLHGELPPRQQDEAVSPGRSGRRKVVVATNVAETSITIDGVTCVIDSGLARTNRYDPRKGLNVLSVGPISRASADQRAGRAGRTAPGIALRLWTSTDHAQREAHETPEVRRLELSEAVLQAKSMGVDPGSFPWLEAPAPEVMAQANALLHGLGAIDEQERLTEAGRIMARFPAHPRLSRMMIEAAKRGCLRRATVWAALIAERDVFFKPDANLLRRYELPGEESDVAIRERALDAARAANFDPRKCTELGVNAIASREVDRTARLFADLSGRLGLPLTTSGGTEELVKCLLVGFPDHVAMKLGRQRADCAVSGRKKVTLDKWSIVKSEGLLIAMEMMEVGRGAPGSDSQTVLSMASHVEAAWLEELYGERMTTRFETRWNDELKAVEQVEERLFEGLVIDRTARPGTDTKAAGEMIVERLRSGELKLEKWDEAVEQWILRTRLVGGWIPERGLITYADDDLRVILHEIVGEATRFSAVRDKPVMEAVRSALSWEDQQFVEKMAPGSVMLPSGYAMKITYREGTAPKGDAKIQQLYGLEDTPRVGGGRQKVLLEILGPNYRPVQVTDDLKSFWANTYPELRKELKRRYPKHEWR